MDEYVKHRGDELLQELYDLSKGLEPWYVVDKVKWSAVYVWSKTDWRGENLFDILPDKIHYFVEDHVIPDEAWPIIRSIQTKMNEIWDYIVANPDAFPNGRWLIANRAAVKEE